MLFKFYNANSFSQYWDVRKTKHKEKWSEEHEEQKGTFWQSCDLENGCGLLDFFSFVFHPPSLLLLSFLPSISCLLICAHLLSKWAWKVFLLPSGCSSGSSSRQVFECFHLHHQASSSSTLTSQVISSSPIALWSIFTFLFIYFYLPFSFLAIPQLMEFPGQRSDPSHRGGQFRPLCWTGDRTCLLVLQWCPGSCCATVGTPSPMAFNPTYVMMTWG